MISSDIGKEVIKKELPLIPKLPGVYKMLSDKDQILYVGKAKNLPNRLKSYVSEKNHVIRTERMLSQTRKIEITTTSNESEALLLEANLIKKHKPKFNILLRDDKSFPFIFIGNKDKYLLDNFDHGLGGSGIKFNWNDLANIKLNNCMIAGGIEIKDLNALKKMGCWGVDLNSKLEDSPGIKNHELLKELGDFIKNG